MVNTTKIKDGYMIVLPWELNKVGGVNQVVKSLLEVINAENNYRSHLLINSWKNKLVTSSEENEVLAHRYRLRQLSYKTFSIKSLFAYLMFLPFEIKKLLKLINADQVKVINAHFPELNLITFAIIKLLKKKKFKFILSFHGSDIKAMSTQSTFLKLQWRFIMHTADKIVPCSQDLGNKLVDIIPSAKNKIQVIHNGIAPENIYHKLDIGSSVHNSRRPYIISIGSLDENKGHDNLIRAFSQLPKLIQLEVDLVILGKDTPYSETLNKIINELSLQESVFVYKDVPHKDTIKTLENSLFLVLASHNEGYPLVFLEAGLLNKAVIATNVGGIPELIKHKETGILIEDHKPQILIEAMSELIQNTNDIRLTYADNLHRKVVKQTWSSVFQGYMD